MIIIYDFNELKEIVKAKVSKKRFLHILGVVETAKKLAGIYGADIEKVKISALLHDVCKEMDLAKLKEIFSKVYRNEFPKEDIENNEILHGPVGAYWVKEILNIKDKEILNAIKYHTVGNKNMGLVEKIVYIADAIEPGRNYPTVEEIRKTTFNNLNEGIILEIKNKDKFLGTIGKKSHRNTLEMKEQLLKELEKKMNYEEDLKKLKNILKDGRRLSFKLIAKKLDWSTKQTKNNRTIIFSWIDSGELIYDRKAGEVFLPNEEDFAKGVFAVVKNKFAFVDVEKNGEKEGIFIPKSSFNNAFDGDTVLVKIVKKASSEKGAEGEVIKVLSHDKGLIVGIIENSSKFSFVIPTHSFGKDIYISKKNTKHAENKSLVIVEIISWGDEDKKPEGKVIKVLGAADDSDNMIEALIMREELSGSFSTESLVEVEEILQKKEIIDKDRRDLRHLPIITIDGADSKDLDDAIYVEKLENNNFKLIVSIADVAHYIKFGSELDLEARKRGNSVYLVDRVLPMFPKEISNGLCSLNPNEDKFTFTCETEIDGSGNVVKSDFYKSVMKSCERMTYKDVNLILDKDVEITKKYSNIKNQIFDMLELSLLLRKKKHKRGSIDFDIPEVKIILDEEKKVKEIKVRERGESERIIEDFMITANEAVAERIFHLEIPSVYRTHERPNRERILNLNEALLKFGYKIPNLDNVHPKQFQEIIENSKEKNINMLVHKMILTSLKQAKYTMEDIGHFGLASSHYTHFTSPIRRYADLMVHRILNLIISKKTDEKFLSDIDLKNTCENISKAERHAMKAEEESIQIKLVEYMSDKIGEKFEAIVTGFSPRKVFFETTGHVECSWDVTTAKHYYEFDEKDYCMLDKDDKNKIFNLGDKFDVTLVKTDLYNLDILVEPIDIV